MIKPLEALDKIGNFIEKYTGSEYNYSEPSGEITEDYTQIGEIFGFPIWMEDNDKYENEFLDFPSLSDILNTIANVGVSFDIKFGECSVCLVVSFSIPLIEYPPIIICLSKPDCKKEEEEKKPDCTPYEDMPYPPEGEDWNYDDLDKDQEFNPICEDEDDPKDNDDNFFGEEGKSYRVEAWYSGEYHLWGAIQTNTFYEGVVDTNYKHESVTEPVLRYSQIMSAPIKISDFKKTGSRDPCSNGGSGGNTNGGSEFRIHGKNQYGFYLSNGRWAGACNLDVWETQLFRRYDAGWGRGGYSLKFFELDGTPVPPKKKKPDSPPIPDPPPMKDCCDEIKKILARIEKQVKGISKTLDVDGFQKKNIQIPSNWIYPGTERKPVIIEDLPDLVAAVARLVDRRLGFLPQLVRLKDADPTKEGDQEINLVINSLADANRLILEYLLQAHGDIGGIQMMGQASLFEAGITHQIAVVIREELEAISAYLGYADGTRKEKFKMAFDPKVKIDPKKPEALDKVLPKLLRHSIQEVVVSDFRGNKTLNAILTDLKKDSANVAASVTRKLSENSLDDLIEETQDIERLKRLLFVREFTERMGISNLKDFLDDAELAYPSSQQSELEKNKPYGFQPIDKPKMSIKTQKSRKNRYKK